MCKIQPNLLLLTFPAVVVTKKPVTFAQAAGRRDITSGAPLGSSAVPVTLGSFHSQIPGGLFCLRYFRVLGRREHFQKGQTRKGRKMESK